MKTYTCGKCGETKAVEQMRRYPSGGVTKFCLDCGGATSGGGQKPRRRSEAASAVSSASPTLEVGAGYGLKASIDDGYLRIEQDDGQGNIDTLMVSRSELILLIAQFREWAEG